MRSTLVSLTVLLLANSSLAFIPTSRMIFDKITSQSGSGAYVIDLELEFQNGGEPLVVKENWQIENERQLRVRSQFEIKGKKTFTQDFLYAGGQRWINNRGRRIESSINKEFFERFFHMRSLDTAAAFLRSFDLAPANALNKKPLPKKLEDNRYDPENFVRLARTQGIVAWAYGKPSLADRKTPGLWIEQDQFVMRKIRFSENSELTAGNYHTYAKGLRYPKSRVVRWGDHEVKIRVISVNSRATLSKELQPSALMMSSQIDELGDFPARASFEEFYQRFR